MQDDAKGLYGGIANASKASKHDLRGCAAVFGAAFMTPTAADPTQRIHTPLMTVIDHMGFRLTAMSVLPISHETIVYGTAGLSAVRNTHAGLAAAARRIAAALNIKRHLVHNAWLHTAFDVEGHVGADHRLYMCDFARLCPPQVC